jgi:hypothetical protein
MDRLNNQKLIKLKMVKEEFINLDSSGLKPIYEGVKPDQDFSKVQC